MGKASAAAKNRWNEKHYDRIMVVVPKGEREEIRAAAESAGQSMNAFIVQAVRERIERLMASAENVKKVVKIAENP